MKQNLSAFQIKKNGKILDYRKGQQLDLAQVTTFFKEKGYEVENLAFESRHVTGILTKKGQEYFLKLATTEGMSYLTENEFEWNKEYNKLVPRGGSDFWVPLAIDSGYFNKNLFYHLSDIFNGTPFATIKNNFAAHPELEQNLKRIISFSELIQSLNLSSLKRTGEVEATNHTDWFIEKTRRWYRGISKEIQQKHQLEELLTQIEKNASFLKKKPRHGDFAPWHMVTIRNDVLGLLDGEHAMCDGVEYYDIAYFIQRAFSVVKNPRLAKTVVERLREKRYNMKNLQTVLAARAIGGFLDESFSVNPDYQFARAFKAFISTDIL